MVKNMVEDGSVEEAIPLPNVKTETLKHIIEFCDYARTHAAP